MASDPTIAPTFALLLGSEATKRLTKAIALYDSLTKQFDGFWENAIRFADEGSSIGGVGLSSMPGDTTIILAGRHVRFHMEFARNEGLGYIVAEEVSHTGPMSTVGPIPVARIGFDENGYTGFRDSLGSSRTLGNIEFCSDLLLTILDLALDAKAKPADVSA